MTSYNKFFSQFLYTEIKEEEGRVIQDCPFCEKPGHLHINLDTSQWDCKKCGMAGNDRIFLTEYHQHILSLTERGHYQQLSDARGISPKWFTKAQWAFDPVAGRWFIPFFNGKNDEGSDRPLANIGNFFCDFDSPEGISYRIFKAAAPIENDIYNPLNVPLAGSVHICEGEWDALALCQILGSVPGVTIVAVPGAHVFKKSFLKKLKGAKEFILLYDNDAAGIKGTEKAAESLKTLGKPVSYLDWSLVESPHELNDIRDLLTKHRPKEARQILADFVLPHEGAAAITDSSNGKGPLILSAGYATDINEFPHIRSVEEYLRRVDEIIYIPDETKLALIASIGLAVAIRQDGEMLWAFLIGPPSSGKTTFIESFGGQNQFFDFMSKITAKALVSGWKAEDGGDSSLLPTLNGKTVFIKDFTVTIAASNDERKEVFGLLRDISDGTVKIPYGNNQIKEYHGIKFNIIAGVTDAIHGVNTAALGERFLKIDFLGQNYNSRRIAKAALQGFGKKSKKKQQFTEATLGFVRHLYETFDPEKIPPLGEETEDTLIDWAEFIAAIRTRPDNDRADGIKYRPRTEIAARLSLQLADLSVGIGHVLNKLPGHPDSLNVLAKVATDTCAGFTYDVVEYIFQKGAVSKSQIAKELSLPSTRVHRITSDLKATSVIVQGSKTKPGKGRSPHEYSLTPRMHKIMESVER